MEEVSGKQNKNAADLLHNESRLQSLRSYQGDVAEAIKNQNESVASIVVKEKIKKEENSNTKEEKNLPVSLTTFLIGIVLLAGTASAGLYIWRVFSIDKIPVIATDNSIISYSNKITLANPTKESLAGSLAEAALGSGVTLIEINGPTGEPIEKFADFLRILKVTVPPALARNLGSEYALGTLHKGEVKSYFLIIKVLDFGAAFSGLLEWEESIPDDLAFIDIRPSPSAISTSTPAVSYAWKDLIIKNKDVRALTNTTNQNEAIIAYTFLDKNTILITNFLSSISELSDTYASRFIVK